MCIWIMSEVNVHCTVHCARSPGLHTLFTSGHNHHYIRGGCPAGRGPGSGSTSLMGAQYGSGGRGDTSATATSRAMTTAR